MVPITMKHFRRTARLARALSPKSIYTWLVTIGYYPEPYVLPPCFVVSKHPTFGRKYFVHRARKFSPTVTQLKEMQFPKNEFSDKPFGIMAPEHYSDIAFYIARNWKTITSCLFNSRNKVCSYSFPIPVDVRTPGRLGKLRSGRMIYEFIEMAENDLSSLAYGFKYILKTDIKNFYASIYTHSIAWAVHGKRRIRRGNERNNYKLVGNRLDKLFQGANDGCTNGIPIGPAVSDLVAELILSAVDTDFSKKIGDDVLAVRFKDDYRILAKSEESGRKAIKQLQSSLREFKLELNEDKTTISTLPDGLFRPWVSEYHAANPNPTQFYSFKRFKEVYLSVVAIDKRHPNTGVIDRFLSDIVTKRHQVRVQLNRRSLPKVISLLLMLAQLRIKAFPRVLAIIEAILKTPLARSQTAVIVEHLKGYLQVLRQRESENAYLLTWLCYFLRANDLDRFLTRRYHFRNDIVRSVITSRGALFKSSSDFTIFTGVKTISKKVSMLRHLDVFHPQ